MVAPSGQDVVDALGRKDLNLDGSVINLAVVGSSRFYDFEVFENAIEDWVEENGYPDLIVVGGASGVDYMAERWADNNSVPIAIFSEEWDDPKRGLQDKGRAEAANSLTGKILDSATHVLALPSSTSKWTRIVIDMATAQDMPTTIHEVD
ncbi:MAG TPA: DUF2493 domain-containing protein [Candidatus Poseidoniales archaeon]|jgi:hypothetical protein|nr:MAG: hypothetical protein CXT64_05520 [Euryarchaeota archaeon]HIE81718.1 DUF2493 domain-containing protein [Candidatus Poseidoniales archaeon]HIL49855.1 DUF2493 domain-containing protein [Candidatus Poseidoniales archaeon]